MSTRILEPGEIGQVEPFPHLVLPTENDLFAHRARRFAQLAIGHPMADFLLAMQALALAQHSAFIGGVAAPIDAHDLQQSRQHGMPPLSYQSVRRDDGWQRDLEHIASSLRVQAVPVWQAALEQLAALSPDQREAVAEAVLHGALSDTDPLQHAALAPLIGAALQVWWTRQAASLQSDDIGHVGSATVCPVCASRPVASVVDIGASQANLRYLHCSLCSTQWHMVRVTCSACESTKGVAYYSLNADQEAATPSRKLAFARAETCDACHSYLKIFSREKEPQMEASADDLATLALDLLVDQAGYLRSGPNLLFSPGIAFEDTPSGAGVEG